MLSEAKIINQLKMAFPNYIGDDAAVLPFSENEHYLITKDLLIETVHFNCRYYDPVSLANKCLQVNLSDLAAMGATPRYIVLGLSIPSHYQDTLPIFLNAFIAACQRANVELIGGDTTRSPDKLFISVTAIGTANIQKIKYRTGAKPGDLLCIAGSLGYAHLGLQAFETNTQGLTLFKDHFLNPIARIAEGGWLAAQNGVTAMMDLSDGLLIDFERLCQCSQVAGIIDCDTLPQSTEFDTACNTLACTPLNTQLTGGEDYSLLITVTPTVYQDVNTSFQAQFGYPLTKIGQIEKGDGVILMHHKQRLSREAFKPFSQFGELS